MQKQANKGGWLHAIRKIFNETFEHTQEFIPEPQSHSHEFDLVTPSGLMEKRRISKLPNGEIEVDYAPESIKDHQKKVLNGTGTEDYIERAICSWILQSKPSFVKSWKQPEIIEYSDDGKTITSIAAHYGLCAKVKSNYHMEGNGWVQEKNLGEVFDEVSQFPSRDKILKDMAPNPGVDIKSALRDNLKNWMDSKGATIKPNLFYFYLGGVETLKMVSEQLTDHPGIKQKVITDKFSLVINNSTPPNDIVTLEKELKSFESKPVKKHLSFYKKVDSKKFTQDLQNGRQEGLTMSEQINLN